MTIKELIEELHRIAILVGRDDWEVIVDTNVDYYSIKSVQVHDEGEIKIVTD